MAKYSNEGFFKKQIGLDIIKIKYGVVLKYVYNSKGSKTRTSFIIQKIIPGVGKF